MKPARDVKVKKKYGIVPKLLCLLFAFGIWIYVMQVDSPEYEETFNLVTVQLEGVSELEASAGLYVYSGYDNTVNVTVTGRRSVINQITADSLTLYADVSSVKDEGRHTIPISAELPAGVALSSLSADSVNVYVGERDEVVLGIKPAAKDIVISSYCRVGDLKPEYDTVTVTGPHAVLSTLDYACAEVYAGNISESTTVISQLSLVDKEGNGITNPYVKLSRAEVRVEVPIFTTKTLPLAVDYKYGYFNSSNVNITIEPQTVEVEGDPRVLETMDKFVVGVIDEKTFKANGSINIAVTDTDKVSVLDDVSSAVVTVEHKGTSTKTINLTDIRIAGGTGKYELIDKELSVTVRGPGQMLADVSADNAYAVADISGYSSSTTGNINVPVSIIFTGDSLTGVYELGTYNVTVKIG